MHVEREYGQRGALAFHNALHIHYVRVRGQCEDASSIVLLSRPVEEAMTTRPYASARRMFCAAGNGTWYRGQASFDRMATAWSTTKLVHLPTHASWRSQIEIFFSMIQRKVLAPNDFQHLEAVAYRLVAFQGCWQTTATAFDRKFTRTDMHRLLARSAIH
jgi:hypothetical protein